jgi:hypothetical protein
MGQSSTRNTGTRDETHDLASILYHALQDAETYDQYISDARDGAPESAIRDDGLVAVP